MRSCQKWFAVAALMLAGSISSFADTCQSGTLSTVLSAGVCTIGGLTFDFTGTTSGWTGFNSTNSATGQQQLPTIQPGDITFVPVINGDQAGFQLVTNVSSSGTAGNNQFNTFYFFYGVATTDGSASLLSVSTSGTGSSSGGFIDAADENSFGSGYASIYAVGCNTQFVCTDANTFWDNGVNGYQSNPLQDPVADLNWYGYTSFYTGAWTMSGGAAASQISSGTVLYQSVGATSLLALDTAEVPEPGTLALLGSGLIGFGLRRFRQ